MARETQEQEVHAAIRYVEALRRPSDSTMFASSLAPNSAGRTTHFDPTLNSPAGNFWKLELLDKYIIRIVSDIQIVNI